ncbi:HAD-IA family hydrolase [Kocuria palustris]|uniref:HAD-IA family hydrolase n=1 Tax=Kocuria palustris TaxID=71999 RepID=UPI0021B2CD57|nr:HAD-IA family hydrolase [Kocuria palustris]
MPLRTDIARNLRLAFIDMSGTSFQDNGIMEQAFTRTLETLGIDASSERFSGMLGFVRDTLGQSKVRVFQHLFQDDPATAAEASREFERQFDDLLRTDVVEPVPGAEDVIRGFQDAGLRVVLATSYNRHSQNQILEHLGWMGLADLSLCPSDAGRGRPYPDMILTALLALDLTDVREVMVVGDTAADMLSGRRAGSRANVGVLTGAHREDSLMAAGADAVVDSLRDIPGLLDLPLRSRTP